jgi:hypothetical protein
MAKVSIWAQWLGVAAGVLLSSAFAVFLGWFIGWSHFRRLWRRRRGEDLAIMALVALLVLVARRLSACRDRNSRHFNSLPYYGRFPQIKIACQQIRGIPFECFLDPADLLDIPVLLCWVARSKHHLLEGREHGRTIPLTDAAVKAVPCGEARDLAPEMSAHYPSGELQFRPKQVIETATISVLSAEMGFPRICRHTIRLGNYSFSHTPESLDSGRTDRHRPPSYRLPICSSD